MQVVEVPLMERPLEWRIASAEAHEVVGDECETCGVAFDRDDRVVPVKDDFFGGEPQGLGETILWHHSRCYMEAHE